MKQILQMRNQKIKILVAFSDVFLRLPFSILLNEAHIFEEDVIFRLMMAS